MNLLFIDALVGIVGLIGTSIKIADTSLTTTAATAAVVVAAAATLSMRTGLRVTRIEGGLLALAYVAIVTLLI